MRYAKITKNEFGKYVYATGVHLFIFINLSGEQDLSRNITMIPQRMTCMDTIRHLC